MSKQKHYTIDQWKVNASAKVREQLEAIELAAKKPKKKYRNEICSHDGIKFDSKKEMCRYRELLLLLKIGEISGLELQKRYLVIEATETTRAASYVADFVYFDRSGNKVCEDVKSAQTRKLPTYILKKKLMKSVHGIDIKET